MFSPYVYIARRSWLLLCLVVFLLVGCRLHTLVQPPAPTPTLAAIENPILIVEPTETRLPLSGITLEPGTLPTVSVETATQELPPTIQPTPAPTLAPTLPPTPSPTAAPTATPNVKVRFAVIGDFGEAGQPAEDIANLIKGWDVDFIITTGDNNYPSGAWNTIDENIGQYYHEYIYPYDGRFGNGAASNRFFPTLGNHDLYTDNGEPYFDYFELPGNERYYDFTWGPLHLFALNSNDSEPDGVGSSSIQANWLRDRLAASTLPWKIVYMHAPPYSSGYHGSTDWMRWPYKEWGASAVLSGHDHSYERLIVEDLPYFVNGLGGGPRYPIKTHLPGSMVQFDTDYGAMLVEADYGTITFAFISRPGEWIDIYSIDVLEGSSHQPIPFDLAGLFSFLPNQLSLSPQLTGHEDF